MFKPYNYLARSVDTPLNSECILASGLLPDRINSLKPEQTAYHCYYDLEYRDTFVGYKGLMRPALGMLHFDFDSEDKDVTPGTRALEDARAFCREIHGLGASVDLYFSGSKGFHVAVHASAFDLDKPFDKAELESKVKAILSFYKNKYSTLDVRIWNANRKFRAHRSMHEKTGLYKIRLTRRGLDISSLRIEDVRNNAKTFPASEQFLPLAATTPIPQLVQLHANATVPPSRETSSTTREVTQGEMIDDSSSKFSNFKSKKCIAAMWESNLPQFNRHDIGLRLVYDLFHTGISESDARKRVQAWATKTFGADSSRVQDMDRIVTDAYTKPQKYSFGCFDDIKQAYCSAKCKVYDQLDPTRRAKPLDCSRRQQEENQPALNAEFQGMSEGQIADQIIAEMGDIVIASDNYFKWENTHWKRIDRDRMTHAIKQCCIAAFSNRAKYGQVDALFKHVLAKIPIAPETNNFFSCSPYKFNFLDGTAHVLKDEKGKVRIELLPHSREDWLASCHPFPLYADHGLPVTGAFEHYLESRRETLGEDGMLALSQLFGAALIPYSPRIFFLLGESNTGKSTAAILLELLLGSENVSGVDPTHDYQFAWEPAVGKIANICRELPARKPFQDDKLKDIRDKRPTMISRKGLKHVMGTLPFLHVYCCNKLPPSLEGNTGALDNRITLLRFKAGHINGFSLVDNLGEHLWSVDSGGVLEFARRGLMALVESNFRYARVEESARLLTEWQDETDPVKAFVQDVKDGFVTFSDDERGFRKEHGSFLAVKVYSKFDEWARSRNFRPMSIKKFYSELERCGVYTGPKTKNGLTILFKDAEHIHVELSRF